LISFFFSSRRRHTRFSRDWSSDVCSSDLKPRDVVSGDFPWYVQIKDEIFIAAVDCTGHGVPGALLSLIGYFLLNDIVRSRKITRSEERRVGKEGGSRW